MERIRAIFEKWEQGGFYQDKTAKLYSVQIHTVQNNRERIGLTVREWLGPESFGDKVHLRPFHGEILQMVAFPALYQSNISYSFCTFSLSELGVLETISLVSSNISVAHNILSFLWING